MNLLSKLKMIGEVFAVLEAAERVQYLQKGQKMTLEVSQKISIKGKRLRLIGISVEGE